VTLLACLSICTDESVVASLSTTGDDTIPESCHNYKIHSNVTAKEELLSSCPLEKSCDICLINYEVG
jgi:hypothetical protein